MKNTTLCPFCAEEIRAVAISCKHCGQYLRSMRLSQAQPNNDLYKIIPDGEHFAIAIRGQVKVNGLDLADLAKAQSIVAILNSFIQDEKAG
jgi:hypothetical protein